MTPTPPKCSRLLSEAQDFLNGGAVVTKLDKLIHDIEEMADEGCIRIGKSERARQALSSIKRGGN
jgi:hypothetical protein